ncbi:MAG: hypothetical protein ABWX69_06585 [Arthrobacter sp.]
MPTRLQIKGSTLEGLEARVLNKFPAGARIVAAEKVTEGGIAGFLARHYFEAVVEIPDPDIITIPAPAPPPTSHPAPPRAGVAALLRDADDAENAMRGGTAARQELPTVSTATGAFDVLLEGLTGTTRSEPDTAPDVPSLLDGPGDAVMVIGLGPDALTVAQSMAASTNGALVRTAGSFRAVGYEHLVSRNGLTSVRADAVIAGQTVFVAFGLSADGTVRAPALTEMKADQVWLAVDATRKPSDTLIWTRRAGWASQTDALAVLNSQNTLTPQSVNDLELPIGWLDDRKANRTVL